MTPAPTTCTIRLCWPSPDLSPNARSRWKKIKATKRARTEGWAAALEVKAHRMTAERLRYRLAFLPPDNRRRDHDNLVSSTKAHRDGIADAVGIDDSLWTLAGVEVGEVTPGGAVLVTLEVA